MCVVGHGHGGLGLDRDGVGGGVHGGQSRSLVTCRKMPEYFLSAN